MAAAAGYNRLTSLRMKDESLLLDPSCSAATKPL